ncbi:MAG: sigma-54-dependent Fis family transcriptional regulator [Bacteroidetes bacterium]|nr:MAG: sigma-54-dependent Fis family transcriptional regulator [Bacteroidota bacterium]
MKKSKILIVDDHDGFRESLVESQILTEKYKVLEAYNGENALDVINANPDLSCIVLDYDFRDSYGAKRLSGLDVMEHLAKSSPHIPIIMISGITEERGRVAIESIKKHAIAFLDKPFPVKTLVEKLDSILLTNTSDTTELDAQKNLSDVGFATVSSIMAKVCKKALEASEHDMNLMILGETGTGKTSLAKAIHKLSKRGNKNFANYECGTLSSDIDKFSSQIFGHVKGAYTGAYTDKTGILEIAIGGTVFFDDITNIPLEVQKGLLKVIEEKEFTRMGDEKKKYFFQARVIAATNCNLEEAIKDNILSKDLKFRLCGDIIKIPPLRMRTDDIPIIVQSYLKNQNIKELKVREISEEVYPLLMRQPWLGNVRQLLTVVQRASNKEKKNEISFNSITESLWTEYDIDEDSLTYEKFSDLDGDLDTTITNIRKKFIIKALKQSKGNVSLAAKELGYINHRGLQYWIEKLGIKSNDID